MASDRVTIDGLADAIMEGLTDYADLAANDMKSAVRKAANTVKSEIAGNAPKDTGEYASSWKVKTTSQNSNKLEQVVYSPTRYQLAHLLEHGHAKRGGGRTSARPHIAPAEEKGKAQLEELITKALKG